MICPNVNLVRFGAPGRRLLSALCVNEIEVICYLLLEVSTASPDILH